MFRLRLRAAVPLMLAALLCLTACGLSSPPPLIQTKVVKVLPHPFEVTDAVPVGVAEAAGVDLVEDRRAPPGGDLLPRRVSWRRHGAPGSLQAWRP